MVKNVMEEFPLVSPEFGRGWNTSFGEISKTKVRSYKQSIDAGTISIEEFETIKGEAEKDKTVEWREDIARLTHGVLGKLMMGQPPYRISSKLPEDQAKEAQDLPTWKLEEKILSIKGEDRPEDTETLQVAEEGEITENMGLIEEGAGDAPVGMMQFLTKAEEKIDTDILSEQNRRAVEDGKLYVSVIFQNKVERKALSVMRMEYEEKIVPLWNQVKRLFSAFRELMMEDLKVYENELARREALMPEIAAVKEMTNLAKQAEKVKDKLAKANADAERQRQHGNINDATKKEWLENFTIFQDLERQFRVLSEKLQFASEPVKTPCFPSLTSTTTSAKNQILARKMV